MRRRNHPRTRQAGVAALELTIALPLLLLIMLATAEIGRALFQYNQLTKGVRDGVRHLASYAILGTTGVVNISTQVRDETRNVVVYGNPLGTGTPLLPGLTPGQVTVADEGGGEISVWAAYPFTPMLGGQLPTFGIGPPIDLTFTMNAAVVMRAL